MGRRKRSNRASSTGSIGEDVKIESPKEAKTRSGLCRAMSEGSHVKDHAQSANSPVLRSRSKRGSPDFYMPAPKRLSAYARSLENKQFSISHDDDSVLVKAKTAAFPSKKVKKGFQKDMMQIKELDTHKGQSGTKQAGAGTSGVNLPKQGPGDSAITNSNRPATRRKSANAGSMASKKAQKEVVEIIELGSNEASEKKCMKHPGQGRGNTGQSTSGNGHLPKATTPSPPDPAYSEHVDMNAAGLLPELVAKMAMAGPNRGGTITKSSHSIHPLRSPDEWLMVLSHPQEIFLRGKAYVRSLQGHVTIHGFLVRPGATFHPFYSPNCSNLLAVSTVQLEAPSGDPRPDANAIRAALANEDRDRVERILSVVNSHSVVLMFKRLECRMCSYVSCIKPFTQLFSGYDDGPTVSPIGTLDLEMVDRLPEMFMKYDDGYKHVVERFCGQVEQGLAPVVVICGGKNVGKSTLTRYLVNSVLNSCDRVAFLECDVGQTEFTLSGCPALCVVTKPLLGPPFTHQRNPHRWCFFGGLSPGAQPREYLHCLRYVYDKYARMDRKPPLVVNTMGWTKGLGVALMVETIKLVRPTLVIQLNSARKAKNFPYITTEFLENDSGFRWKNCEVRNDAKKTEHELVILNSPVSAYLDGHEKYRPKDQRNLMTLAYFGQLQPQQGPLKDLAELQPYEVPWSAVGVHICTGRVANSQYMYVLNASIVALCIADKKQMHQENDPTYPKFFERTPICQGVGFGIVRAIDCEKKVFYILTPVPWAELVKVNCLLRGDLELPEQLLLQQRSQGHHPYTGNPSDVIGASSTKKRRHMFRQKRGTNR